jgi:multiple sugar transport system permease protein
MRRALARHLVPGALALLFLAPVLLMVSGSLRPAGQPPAVGVELWPAEPTLEAYRRLPGLLPVWTYLASSSVVVALAVPLTVLVASWAGFGMQLLSSRLRRWAIGASLVVMMVPVTAVWATRFEVFRLLGLVDTYVPLVAPALMGTTPFYALVYAWSFSGIPASQWQAATLEGAGLLRTWRRIAMPQARPATLAVAVLAFGFHWSNLIDPLLYLQSADRYTLPLGLQFLRLLNPTDWPLLMAACVLVTAPSVAVFLLAQRVLLADDPLRAVRGGRR